jgi:hypothetical protein
VPMGLHYSKGLLGTAVVNDCLLCHAGVVAGQTVIGVTGRSAYHGPVSIFPGQHIGGRERYCGAPVSLSRAGQPIFLLVAIATLPCANVNRPSRILPFFSCPRFSPEKPLWPLATIEEVP